MLFLLRALVLFDCILNWLFASGEITETLSSHAHRMRVKPHKYWGWCADAIDFFAGRLFNDPDHCRRCWYIEQFNGSALFWLPRWLFVKVL